MSYAMERLEGYWQCGCKSVTRENGQAGVWR